MSSWKKPLGFALRLCIVSAALSYALWRIDLGRMMLVMGKFDLKLILGGQLYMFLLLVLPALRMRFLTGKKAGFFHSYKAVFLGLGINNILPARLGEVAKGIYLKKEVGIPLSRGLNIIFWERFSDLNAVLLLVLVNAAFFIQELVVTIAFLGPVAGLWCLLIVHKKWPHAVGKLLQFMTFRFINSFLTQFFKQVEDHFEPRFLGGLLVYALCVWALFTTLPYYVLWEIAGLNLSFGQILTVIVISCIGMSIPSSPGAIGVYEASVMAPLIHFGVGKEQALASAIVLHMIQYIPTTMVALLIMLKTGLGIKSFRLREHSPTMGVTEV